jgi:hypothetical protein
LNQLKAQNDGYVISSIGTQNKININSETQFSNIGNLNDTKKKKLSIASKLKEGNRNNENNLINIIQKNKEEEINSGEIF